MNARFILSACLSVLFCLITILPVAAQTTWYVDDDAPNDPGPGDTSVSDLLEDGTAGHPFDAIQEGIDAASNGDTVTVSDGSYTGGGNYFINFSGKAIKVQSANGAESCEIDLDGPSPPGGVVFENGEGPGSVLEGFRIHGAVGVDWLQSTPIRIYGASPTIESNIIEDNSNGASGAQDGNAIYCSNSEAIIQYNLIQNNFSEGGSGCIYCVDSDPKILFNTIHDNYCIGGGGIHCRFSSPEIIGNVITDTICDYGGAGIHCNWSSSPIINDNVISGNRIIEGDSGGGIFCGTDCSPLIINNVISGNNRGWVDIIAQFDGGGIGCYSASPVIVGNIITDNAVHNASGKSGSSDLNECTGAGIACRGTGSPIIVNNHIAGNFMRGLSETNGFGGGIYCGPDTVPTISNNTIIDNYHVGIIDSHGLGIYCESPSAIIVNCIVRGNESDQINGCDGLVSYSNVEGGYPGTGNIDADPLFIAGPDGCYYLSHTATGQSSDSPCVDAGSGPAAVVCFSGIDETICLDDLTTRIDQVTDSGMVDMGYHHGGGVFLPCPPTVGAEYTCIPASGTLPFSTTMSVTMQNLFTTFSRRVAGRIDVTVAGGGQYSNWRVGWTNLAGGSSYVTSWNQNMPALSTLTGDNLFELAVRDVTPSPYNQPPYPQSGHMAVGECRVTAIAP